MDAPGPCWREIRDQQEDLPVVGVVADNDSVVAGAGSVVAGTCLIVAGICPVAYGD